MQGQRFGDAQAAGVDGSEARVIVKGLDTAQEPVDFIPIRDTGKPLRPCRVQVGEQVPVALQHLDEEEADTAVSNAQGG